MNNEVVDPHLTTKIVSSYVRCHAVGADQVSELITSVHRALTQLGQPIQPEQVRTPAVSVRQSVRQDHVVCLDCGYRGKTLPWHISSKHRLSRDEYLKRWGLRTDHPLTAPAYSEQRSILAKERRLGRKATAEIAAEVAPTAAASVDTDPKFEARTLRRRSTGSPSKSDAVSEAAAARMPARQRRRHPKSRTAATV